MILTTGAGKASEKGLINSEKSLDILSDKGIFGFIIPNSLLYQSSYEKMRKIILKDWNIDGQIIEVLQTDSWKDIASIHIRANLENPFIPKTYLLGL